MLVGQRVLLPKRAHANPPRPQAHPDFRQASALLENAESEVIKDGLVGVTAGAAVLGAVIGIVAAVARKR